LNEKTHINNEIASNESIIQQENHKCSGNTSTFQQKTIIHCGNMNQDILDFLHL
jgi:hypothetical protein